MTATDSARAPRANRSRGRGQGLRLRETRFEDYERIGELESAFGLAPGKSSEEWSHLWLGNPLYQELQPSWSIGWVLEHDDGRILGSIGNVPIPYMLNGRRLVVAASRAWVAQPECRGASLLLLDNLLNQPQADLFLSNTTGRASTDSVRQYECLPVPVGRWDEAAFWITNPRGFAKSFAIRRGWPTPSLVGSALGPVVSVAGRIRGGSLRRFRRTVLECTEFDERFDLFWEELVRASPGVLRAVRTRDMLQWHFTHALQHRRLWIGTISEGDHLVAYAIFDRRDVGAFAFTRARLVDFQSLDGGTSLLPPLLDWAAQKCAAEGIHALESFGVWLEPGEVIARLAPYRRRLQAWSFYYRAKSPALAETLRDPRVWAPSLFDSDGSLAR